MDAGATCRRRSPATTIFAALALAAAFAGAAPAATPEAVEAERGMVVTSQHIASEVGAGILVAGGNAIDAAVAVGYALAVVEPCCGNIGGGGFMTIHLADGRDTFINFRETAPAAAAAGAVSRKLMKVSRPSLRWMVMNPPPPRLPQHGSTTASA